jgi:hypothetical protein
MLSPQPYFKIRERAIPVQHLQDQGKEKPGYMDDLYDLTSCPDHHPEDKKQYPGKMNENSYICEYSVHHSQFLSEIYYLLVQNVKGFV